MKNFIYLIVITLYSSFVVTLKAQPFIEKSGSALPLGAVINPLTAIDVGFGSAPVAADLDQDGDKDLIIGNYAAELRYFENNSTGNNATFIEQTGTANPFDGLVWTSYTNPAIGDLNNDNLPDLLIGENDGNFYYFLNTGSIGNPAFTEQTGGANPFSSFNVGEKAAPTFVDIDNDGDLDLFSGEQLGTFYYFENIGTISTPVFQEVMGTSNPFDGEDVGFGATIAFWDWDEDGDLDAYCGNNDGTPRMYENQGTVSNPQFFNLNLPSLSDSEQNWQVPTIIDLEGDGEEEVIVGTSYGILQVLKNTGLQRILSTESDPTNSMSSGFSSTSLAFVDMDDDNDFDAFMGEGLGKLRYFENTGSISSASFSERTGTENPLDIANVGLSSTSDFVDIDNDGDQDAFVWGGDFLYYKNEGDAINPNFVEQSDTNNPLFLVGEAPDDGEFIDLDDDGDWDCVMTDWNTEITYYLNTGTASNPNFVLQTATNNPFENINPTPGNTSPGFRPALTDLDGDGDIDAAFGDEDGLVYFVENIGTVNNPIFEVDPANNWLGTATVNGNAIPEFCDLDNDGKINMLVAGDVGFMVYHEVRETRDFYTSWFTFPASNSTTGGDFAPAFVDIDNDNDLDIFVGVETQKAYFFENIGTPTQPAFLQPPTGYNPLFSIQNAVDFAVTPAFHYNQNNQVWDAYMGGGYGNTWRWKNNGSPTQPSMSYSSLNGLNAANVSCDNELNCQTAPTFADVNGDGNMDALLAYSNGSGDFEFVFLDCTNCSSNHPGFTKRIGAVNPFSDITVGQVSSFPAPALGDLDGDGDPDLVVGTTFGTLVYYENIGTATTPVYEQKTGADNPFNGEDYGSLIKPCLGDMDSDGDMDVLIGTGLGVLIYLENQRATPLSIHSIEWTGTATTEHNILKAVFPKHLNISNLSVQKSETSMVDDWVVIENLPNITENSSEVMYHFIDENPFPITYYRLNFFDKNGKTKFSETIFIERKEQELDWQILPNPATDVFEIQLDLEKETLIEWTISDVLGRTVWVETPILATGQTRFDFNSSTWERGVYFVHLKMNGRTYVQKFVLQ